ncbi:uncharacterized protein TEOVI_000039400 [Trypanosoma equiperdum]|uniref:Uncharacterized protein n=2 Tax=Trypanozoon TaxID=39700 RepID=Q38FP6_TRYB2|nr:hypothetical protein, unlikely [Trypanosoma brucei brucei TREU927]EAN76374.1 hypothetical protein, unlikely [Trypanosoma brucei brucei TREU927]SCU67106.1 hypothetical protein, conserved [Trypanosoma equiperdum]
MTHNGVIYSAWHDLTLPLLIKTPFASFPSFISSLLSGGRNKLNPRFHPLHTKPLHPCSSLLSIHLINLPSLRSVIQIYTHHNYQIRTHTHTHLLFFSFLPSCYSQLYSHIALFLPTSSSFPPLSLIYVPLSGASIHQRNLKCFSGAYLLWTRNIFLVGKNIRNEGGKKKVPRRGKGGKKK